MLIEFNQIALWLIVFFIIKFLNKSTSDHTCDVVHNVAAMNGAYTAAIHSNVVFISTSYDILSGSTHVKKSLKNWNLDLLIIKGQ